MATDDCPTWATTGKLQPAHTHSTPATQKLTRFTLSKAPSSDSVLHVLIFHTNMRFYAFRWGGSRFRAQSALARLWDERRRVSNPHHN
jgi:hypothetical protein